jgi:hypothetical protein
MPRRKQPAASAPPVTESVAAEATAVAETPAIKTPARRPGWIDGTPVTQDGQPIRSSFEAPEQPLYDGHQDRQPQGEHGKNWGPPYKSIFTCREMGFELGENRRFKQRVFMFSDRPADEVLGELKANGFTYRAAEKAWTITANAETRKLTDELARKWAGPNYIQGMER